jgi:oligosaccharide repeat unit polymerase
MLIENDLAFLFILLIMLLLAIYDIGYFIWRKKLDLPFLFVNMNLATVILFLTYQSSYLKPITLGFLILNISYISAFVLGYCFAHRRRRFREIDKNNFADLKLKVILHKFNAIGFLIFLAAFSYELKSSNWIPPIFAANKISAYHNFPVKFICYLVVSGVPISLVSFCIIQKYRYRKKTNYFIIITVAMLLASTLARAMLMAQLCGLLYMHFRKKNIRISMRKIILTFCMLLILIYVLGRSRLVSGENTSYSILEIGMMDNWPKWAAPFSWIYLYLTTSLENFRNSYELVDKFTYGAVSFLRPVLTLLQMKESSLLVVDNYFVSAGPFNTPGYGLDVYSDFGFFGFIYTFLLGFISKLIVRSSKPWLFIFSSIWVYAVFTSPVNNYFNAFFLYIYLAYIYLIFKTASLAVSIKKNYGSKSYLYKYQPTTA